MPHSIIDSHDKYQTMIRPAIIQVCDDIKQVSGIPNETEIIYLGYSDQKVNRDTAMGDVGHRGVDFSHKNYLLVESDISYQDASYYSGQPYLSTYSPIFHDKSNKINLSPIYHIVDIKLSLRYMTEDRPAAYGWEAEMRRKIGQSILGKLHRLEYTFPVPLKHLATLNYLHGLIYPSEEPEKSFSKWLGDIAEDQITVLVNQAGETPLLAVNQVQLGVLGTWEINPTPSLEKTESGDKYTVSFNYNFHFDVVGSTMLTYPIMVNNVVISDRYRRNCKFEDPLVLGEPGLYIWATDRLRPATTPKYPTELVILPCFDEWRVKYAPMRTSSLYTAMIVINDESPTDVMNLAELGDDYALAGWVISMLTLFHDKLTFPGQSPFIAQIYRNDHWMDVDTYVVDGVLNVVTNEPMIHENIYHVRLAVYTDLTLLSEHAINKLLVYGELTIELLKLLGRGIEPLPTIASDGSISRIEFFEYISKLRDTHPSFKNGIDVRWLRVSTCVITTERVEENATV